MEKQSFERFINAYFGNGKAFEISVHIQEIIDLSTEDDFPETQREILENYFDKKILDVPKEDGYPKYLIEMQSNLYNLISKQESEIAKISGFDLLDECDGLFTFESQYKIYAENVGHLMPIRKES